MEIKVISCTSKIGWCPMYDGEYMQCALNAELYVPYNTTPPIGCPLREGDIVITLVKE